MPGEKGWPVVGETGDSLVGLQRCTQGRRDARLGVLMLHGVEVAPKIFHLLGQGGDLFLQFRSVLLKFRGDVPHGFLDQLLKRLPHLVHVLKHESSLGTRFAVSRSRCGLPWIKRTLTSDLQEFDLEDELQPVSRCYR